MGDNVPDGEVSEHLLKGQSLGMILLRCQELLKNSGADGLTTYDLQRGLCCNNSIYGREYYIRLFSDYNFINVLKNNIYIKYQNKKWFYKSPYDDYIVSMEALLSGVNSHENGMEITQDLLDLSPNVPKWIYILLQEKRVRALRTGKLTKCKYNTMCDLYDPREKKCDNCSILKNITLYNKARPVSDQLDFENNDANFEIDEDLKEMWHQVKLPEMRKIMEEMRNKDKMKQLEMKRRPKKRGGGSDPGGGGFSSNRVNKIANVHIYSLDEYKSELSNVT